MVLCNVELTMSVRRKYCAALPAASGSHNDILGVPMRFQFQKVYKNKAYLCVNSGGELNLISAKSSFLFADLWW